MPDPERGWEGSNSPQQHRSQIHTQAVSTLVAGRAEDARAQGGNSVELTEGVASEPVGGETPPENDISPSEAKGTGPPRAEMGAGGAGSMKSGCDSGVCKQAACYLLAANRFYWIHNSTRTFATTRGTSITLKKNRNDGGNERQRKVWVACYSLSPALRMRELRKEDTYHTPAPKAIQPRAYKGARDWCVARDARNLRGRCARTRQQPEWRRATETAQTHRGRTHTEGTHRSAYSR